MLSGLNPSLRQIWVALGAPGNGVVVQSANAQSDAGIATRASASLPRRVSTASRVSRLAAGKLAWVSAVNAPLLRFCVVVGEVTMYSPRTRPVIALPLRRTATGTVMVNRPP